MRTRPFLVIAVGVVFTSFSAIFIRLSDAPPFIIASYRMWFTTALVGILLARDGAASQRRSTGRSPGPGSRPPVILLSIASGVFLSIHFGAWIASLQYTSVSSSTVLVSTHPVIVAIASVVILHERLSWKKIGFVILALAGGSVLVIGGYGEGGSAPLGNLLAFVGAVAVSGYMLIGRIVRQHLTGNRYTVIVYGVSAVLLTLYAIAARNPLFGYSARELLIFLGLAVVCTLLGHSLFNWALRFLSPLAVSMSTLGEPVLASLFAILVFRELPTRFTLVGGIVILVSIFLFLRESGRTQTKQPG